MPFIRIIYLTRGLTVEQKAPTRCATSKEGRKDDLSRRLKRLCSPCPATVRRGSRELQGSERGISEKDENKTAEKR